MINKPLPRFRTLEITVNLKKLDGVFGYCLAETTREFELEVAKGLSLKNLVGIPLLPFRTQTVLVRQPRYGLLD